MGRNTSQTLAEEMVADSRDFTLDEVYRKTCKPPHLEMLTPDQLHRRISRYVGEVRQLLKAKGYVLIQGEKRHSYKAVKRKPLGK